MADSTILCVDDDVTVLNALRTVLQQQLGPGHHVELAMSGNEALEILDELRAEGTAICTVIADYIMPGMKGDELLARIHQQTPDTVTIMLTGQSDLQGVQRAVNEANLYRFLEKPFHNEDIVMTVRSALQKYHLERELERRNAELERINAHLEQLVAERTEQLRLKNEELQCLAQTDRLTGLYNRVKLDETLSIECQRVQRYGHGVAVLLLDVDHFKKVNDVHGHQAGDSVLVALARLLREHTRTVDVVGRWGGEEFLVVAPGTDLEGARELADKLLRHIGSHVFPVVGRCTASFGGAICQPGETPSSLLGRADQALYRAKALGRNRVEWAGPPD